MILAVCLNPAVDVTYEVDAMRPGASHKVSTVHRLPGGKGVNVARVLAQLGEPVTLCGLAGGGTGHWLRTALAGSDVTDRLTEIGADTRQTITVIDGADATVFNEPGPALTGDDWARFTEAFGQEIKNAEVVVMSGSVPPGAPADAYAFLVRLVGRHNRRTVVDAADAQLQFAIDAGPTILAPNRAELGLPDAGPADLLKAASGLSHRSGGTVVISAGSEGLVASDGRRCWTVRPPRHITGNPTGAGDALTAALARGLVHGNPMPTVLADATALAAAAVAVPTAGRIDEPLYRELTASSTVQEATPCP